jgi:outer membrane protein W
MAANANWAKQTSSRQGASQNVAFNAAGGASAASTTFGVQTYQIRVAVSGTGFVAGTGGARIVIGDGTPTATATSMFLPNAAVEYFTCTPGQKIAVLGNDAGTGNLSVTEMQ